MISLSEFIMSGRVSFPYTYYSTIRSLATGTIFTYRLNEQGGISASHIRYFDFAFEPDATATLDGMAEELAVAIESSVRKRTLPIFGKCAVALSGGLDSRTVLGAIKDRSNVVAVSFFDEENYEFRIAQRIAQKLGSISYQSKEISIIMGKQLRNVLKLVVEWEIALITII